ALAESKTLFKVAAGAFNPPPKVESAVVRVTPRADPAVRPDEEQGFSRFVIAAFSQRRKQLGSIVRSVTALGTEAAAALVLQAGIDPKQRPENLSAVQFADLYRALSVPGASRP